MKKSTWVILGIAAVAVIWCVSAYNSLISGRESAYTAWSDVETQYQRRSDLVPNLVAVVKGYAEHESSTLAEVVSARSSAFSPESVEEFQAQENKVSSALGRLLAVVENYPELKANENFLDLQAQLEGTENRIAESRRLYNERAREYNTSLKTFPKNVIASMFSFEESKYFSAEEASKTAPVVKF